MTGNRYYLYMRKSSGSFSRYKLSLQSAVSIFFSDYRDYVSHAFVCNDSHTRRRRELIVADDSIHAGTPVAGIIKWDVTYLSLRVNEDLKMNFFIRTDYSLNNQGDIPEFFEKVFQCSVWAVGEHLLFDLKERDGTLIRHFCFNRPVTKGTFRPVVAEIQKYLHLGKPKIAIQVETPAM